MNNSQTRAYKYSKYLEYFFSSAALILSMIFFLMFIVYYPLCL
nr:MAG TPA: hypothetical protein [Caudoviricetes sp.]